MHCVDGNNSHTRAQGHVISKSLPLVCGLLARADLMGETCSTGDSNSLAAVFSQKHSEKAPRICLINHQVQKEMFSWQHCSGCQQAAMAGHSGLCSDLVCRACVTCTKCD